MKKRYQMLAFLLSVLMTLALLGGCSKNAAGGTAGSANAGAAGKTDVTMGICVSLTSLEPMTAFTREEQYVIANVFDTLFELKDGEYVGELATEFEMSEDLTSISCTLRDDVYFHNGEKLTASDVAYCFNNLGNFSFWANNAGYIDHAEAIDDTHVVIYGTQPNVFLMNVVSNIEIANEKAVTELGDEHKWAPVGTGAYKLVSYDKVDTIKLELNEDYFKWDELGVPPIKNVTYKVFADETAMANALEAGEIDMVSKLGTNYAENFKDNADYTVNYLSSDGVYLVLYNCGAEPFNNKLVRQAIGYALDRDSLNMIVSNGTNEPWDYFYSVAQAGAPDYDALPHYSYDPDKAKELLTEAGYPDGIQLDPMPIMESEQNYAVAVQSQLKEVGINFEIEILEQNTLFDRIFAMDYQILCFSLSTEIYDMSYNCNYFKSAPYKTMMFPCGDWGTDELDQLITQAETTTDIEARKELYTQIYTILFDEQPMTATLQSQTSIVRKSGLEYSRPNELKVLIQNLSWK
jgi:peptide/nickel transport system substrate-binding protein